MTQIAIGRQRTVWDIIFGILLVIGGIIVLGDVMVATAVSVLFLGWLALIAGIIGVIASLFKIGKGHGFWSTILTGALLTVLGLMILRNPTIGAATITLLAGFMFLVGGIVRIIAAFETSSSRWVLVISGVASVILGLIVLFNPIQATFTLIGILLGIQMLIDGITLILFGRVHIQTSSPATG